MKNKQHLGRSLLTILVATALAGCGGGATSATAGTSSGEGGGSSVAISSSTSASVSSHTVTISPSQHGIVTADKLSPKDGESVVLTITPEAHYVLKELKVNSETVSVTGTTYTIVSVKGDVTVSASFIGQPVTLHFDTGDNGTIADVVVHYNDVYGTLPSPQEKAGFVFKGWFLTATGGVAITADAIVDTTEASLTLYAHYEAATYTITLDPGEGSADVTTIEATSGAAIGALPVAVRDGYVMTGWQDAAGTIYTAETIFTANKAITLTAVYAAVKVEGAPTNLLKLPNASEDPFFTLTITAEGYTFQALTLTSESTAVTIDGLKVSLTGSVDHSSIALVAKENGVAIKTINFQATNYAALGYKAITTTDEFKAINGTDNYVVTADLDFAGATLATIATNLNGIIDGAGHTLSNFQIRDGWNGSLFLNMVGSAVIRDCAFLGVKGPAANSFGSGLISLFKGGTIENIVLDYQFMTAAGSDLWSRSGSLVGDMVGEADVGAVIKNSLIIPHSSVDASNNGLVMGGRMSFASTIENVAVVSRLSNPLIAGLASGMVAGTDDTFSTLNKFTTTKALIDGCTYLSSINGALKQVAGALNWNDTPLLAATPEWAVLFASKSLSMHKNDDPTYLSYSVENYGVETTDYSATYASSKSDIATIGSDGLITPVAVGSTDLSVTVGGVTATITLTVTNALVHITDFAGLKAIGDHLDYDYVLDNDIDCAGGGFWNDSNKSYIMTFTGSLDGKGHLVKNLWLAGGWNEGFIYEVDGTVKNIGFTTMYSGNKMLSGGFFGKVGSTGVVDNVYVDFVLTSDGTSGSWCFQGALVGIADGHISDCVINIRSNSTTTSYPYTATLIGNVSAWATSVKNCFAITNGLTFCTNGTYYQEAASGVAAYCLVNCANYANYAALKAGATVTDFSSTLWSFGDSSLSFGGNVVI
jgi:uncharacterized repeat protein (TIGR02543 family)